MTSLGYFFGAFVILCVGWILRSLLTGRVRIADYSFARPADSLGYWYSLVFLVLLAGLMAWALHCVVRDDPDCIPLVSPIALLFAYHLGAGLISGVARTLGPEASRECEPRRYWKHIAVYAFITATAVGLDLLKAF